MILESSEFIWEDESGKKLKKPTYKYSPVGEHRCQESTGKDPKKNPLHRTKLTSEQITREKKYKETDG